MPAPKPLPTATDLDRLPVALTQAASTIRALGIGFGEYRRLLADYLRLSLLDIPEVYACGRLPLRGDVLAVADEFQRAADRLRNLEHTLALLEEQADMLDGHIDGEGIE